MLMESVLLDRNRKKKNAEHIIVRIKTGKDSKKGSKKALLEERLQGGGRSRAEDTKQGNEYGGGVLSGVIAL